MFFVLAGGLFWGFSLLNIFGLFGHFKNWKERWGMIVGWGAKFGPEGSNIIGSPSGNPE